MQQNCYHDMHVMHGLLVQNRWYRVGGCKTTLAQYLKISVFGTENVVKKTCVREEDNKKRKKG